MKKWIGKMLAPLLGMLLTKDNMVALLKWASPLVLEMIRKRMAEGDQAKLPTEDELKADIESNADVYIAEGQAWLEANPKR